MECVFSITSFLPWHYQGTSGLHNNDVGMLLNPTGIKEIRKAPAVALTKQFSASAPISNMGIRTLTELAGLLLERQQNVCEVL